MIALAATLIVGLFIVWGVLMFIAISAHTFNTIVDWFMR